MIVFKSGYYIEEIDRKLKQIAGDIYVEKFYKENLFSSVSNFPEFVDLNNTNPLLKVVWNIISRGEPTVAFLSLSEVILKDILKQDFLGVSTEKPEVELKIVDGYFDRLDNNLLIDLLTDFKQIDLIRIASDFGTKYLQLYQILSDLISASQVERTILLILLSKSNNKENKFNIIGIRKTLIEATIKDINLIINHLNNLIGKEEKRLNLIEYSEDPSAHKIYLNKNVSGAYCIDSNISDNKIFYSKILTDRRLNYPRLGQIKEEEDQGKYIQKFIFDTEKQEEALTFFLQSIFRKSKFKPGQLAIINRAVQCKDVIGLLPTGGGKSLTYQICSLLQPGVTIVVDPINSLMKDQYDKLREYGFSKVNFINSFINKEERRERLDELSSSNYLILFVSPERFQMEEFRLSLKACNNNNVFYSYAVIDEAHCVSEWGHDFRHTYLRLAKNLKRFCCPKSGALTLFGLTATASYDVLADVQRELEITEDAIITLPAESIDRKELNFEIVKINHKGNGDLEYWEREKNLGELKYPTIKNFLDQMPHKINKLESIYGYFNTSTNFYIKNSEVYKNSGVIFCPTKSNRLRNGVLSLYDYLQKVTYLNITTFFGSGDDDTVKDSRIESEAALSYKNQEEFIKNRKNLMIATKAFGMGIDKPNIRFSIHYSFPTSVESFYQEAGRAGRDGYPAICSIIYHPDDIYTNYDFYRNAFKGIKREKEIIDELLQEVQYEDDFYLNVLKRQVQDKFPEVHSMRIWNNRYIYINGPWSNDPKKKITIGNIDLERDLRSYDDATKNFELQKARGILEYTKEIMRKESPTGYYLSWLKTKSADGIRTMIESGKSSNYSLKIGFTNDTISKMTEVITGLGYEDFEDIVVRAAYNFCSDENDFISNLKYQYGKFTNFRNSLSINTSTEEYLKTNFNKIRNSSDTQRAIYRMSIAGIIDDYVIDYVGRFIEVRFKPKSDKEYIESFRTYLKRYLGAQSTEKWINRVNRTKENSILKKVLYVLINFIESEISEKRKRSIDYMQQLCEVGHQQGDKVFRENIVYYFTSKYARLDYLPKDTDGGRIEKISIVKKYLDYIENPPDGLGGEIDNAKHLRGACANLRITMTTENACIDLLTAYSLIALEAKEGDNLKNALERPLVKQAIELYRKGFNRFSQIEDWKECKELLSMFNNKILDINPVITPLLEPLTQEILISRTTFRLDHFLNKFKEDGKLNQSSGRV